MGGFLSEPHELPRARPIWPVWRVFSPWPSPIPAQPAAAQFGKAKHFFLKPQTKARAAFCGSCGLRTKMAVGTGGFWPERSRSGWEGAVGRTGGLVFGCLGFFFTFWLCFCRVSAETGRYCWETGEGVCVCSRVRLPFFFPEEGRVVLRVGYMQVVALAFCVCVFVTLRETERKGSGCVCCAVLNFSFWD
ncbi:hypothetical protein B0T25DRAFT_119939 [Lasiosphaeria hispida]|uniref:Uncharacterized protein n=1 Tax=Lasiosphaeria hispida TaxID=260671 RepID=A0AAJ0MIB1_9PEZI|nr:hypothetical protein B0T25DRAFT_119939 [Lasiosphaeria hispida]